jgi:hypothetical protein
MDSQTRMASVTVNWNRNRTGAGCFPLPTLYPTPTPVTMPPCLQRPYPVSAAAVLPAVWRRADRRPGREPRSLHPPGNSRSFPSRQPLHRLIVPKKQKKKPFVWSPQGSIHRGQGTSEAACRAGGECTVFPSTREVPIMQLERALLGIPALGCAVRSNHRAVPSQFLIKR